MLPSIWIPNKSYENYALKQIVHRALRLASFKTSLPMFWIRRDYAIYNESLKVAPIRSIHRYNDLMVVYKVLNNQFWLLMNSGIHFLGGRLTKQRGDIDCYWTKSTILKLAGIQRKPVLRKLWNGVVTSSNTDVRITQFKRFTKDLSYGLV